MSRLFLTAPVDVDLPPGWVRVDTPSLHRAAFSPEMPGDYPLPRILIDVDADAVVLVGAHTPPFYPRRMMVWSGKVITQIDRVTGVLPACAYRWYQADVVVTQLERLGRVRMPPVHRSIEGAVEALFS